VARGRLAHGELERRVLEVLWDEGRAMTPRQVHDRLVQGRELAYTTTMTVLARLWDKGRLDREPAGRTFRYQPRLSREETAARRMSELLAVTGDGSVTLARFVETLSPAQRAQLRRMIGQDG
jgi:predicted transcriptional regulator